MEWERQVSEAVSKLQVLSSLKWVCPKPINRQTKKPVEPSGADLAPAAYKNESFWILP
jgi:hypothetical protein